jgi:CRP-like cAMP-binding protein
MKIKQIHCDSCESKDKGIFCELNHDELNDLSNHKITNTYKRGQTLFFEGNPPYGIYCLKDGKIKITKTGPDGREIIVRITHAGEIVGHRSLLSEQHYSATATALEDATVCFIDKKWILQAIQETPSVAINLIKKLSLDMGAAEAKLASMGQRNVRERLAELLLLLKESYGVKENNVFRLDVRLTREEMASMIGVANETLIRFMSEFKELEMIDQKGKIIYITDEKKLVEFANVNL